MKRVLNFKKIVVHSKRNILMSLLPLSLAFFTAGCSLDASIESLAAAVKEVYSKNQEVVPASSQNAYTTRGFKVQASVSYQDAPSEVLTGRGYKAYTNVQGNILKE